jgi:hypothetical protein
VYSTEGSNPLFFIQLKTHSFILDMKQHFFALTMGVLSLALVLSSCKKDTEDTNTSTPTSTSGTVKVEFEHLFGSEAFALGTTYTTGSGEQVSFNTTKYYISNIKFTKADGTVWAQPESYYLIDLSDESTALLSVSGVPTGDYTAVSFMVGVDSTRCVSGAQTGALSTTNNMFWSWNSGYIMSKFEGTSSASSTGAFTFHLGGFYGANATQHTDTWDFGPSIMSVSPSASPQIHMAVDVKQLFDNAANVISVSATNNVTMPGATAVGLSENFFSGIEFEHLHN